MMKSGGQVFGSIFTSPSPHTKTLKLQQAEVNKPWSIYFKDYKEIFHDFGPDPVDNVSKSLTSAGFRIDFIDLQHVQAEYPSEEVLYSKNYY